MATMPPPDDAVLTSEEQLLRVFHDAEKPKHLHRVGAEMEKFGVDRVTGAPIHFDGERGVSRFLAMLAEDHGWAPESEAPGAPVISLTRAGASITLEPGSQLELSGAPLEHAHQICAEFRGHLAEIAPLSERLGLRWLGLGFHPFARRSDLDFIPKQRYAIMREYLPRRGALALDMMLRTSTVQANFDYVDEADAMRKMQLSLRVQPLVTAMFGNAPFYEGGLFGGKSYRAKVWLEVDPDRSGLVPGLWKKDAGYKDYVAWALGVPMFMFKRDGKPVVNTGQSFGSFLEDGFEGHHARYSDWVTHLNTLFPEVRLKKTIEVRGADAQGAKMACALPALFTGILYDARALDDALALTESWTLDEVTALRQHVWRDGLASPFRGGTLAPIAEKVMDIAKGGLERRKYLSTAGRDERVHLARLEELVAHGRCPADLLTEGLAPGKDLTQAILERADLGTGH